ncbi:MAG: bifunctional methylenetetrahydrofolate dehydrogenase/methenyltetrahydrofolate cyclohydrolase FolD [Alphaproteobacteria bacterium]
MAEATIIDGKAFAANLRAGIAKKVAALKGCGGPTPGLSVVLVGENPASQIYTRNKAKQTVEAGMQSFKHDLPAETSQEDLLALVDRLNHDTDVHGILVQLPLPDQIDPNAVIDAINPAKDVDGFNVVNVGRLVTSGEGMIPCTPLGCMMLLKDTLGDLKGKRAIVVGRSNIVGKPMAFLLLREHCTVTMAHSKTQNLAEECRRADILIAATGQPRMVRGDWVKPGAAVIDVGINRIEGEDGKSKLVGDVAFDEALAVAGAITPVPGGVGPMTIACLLQNTFTAACRQAGFDPESF